jgi:hypothetical protein
MTDNERPYIDFPVTRRADPPLRGGTCLARYRYLPNRRRPYSPSEVIHRAGDESLFPAFERERPRIVNNFAASASSGYELSSVSEKMNWTRLSNLAVVLGSGNEYSDEDESSLETITSGYKEFASDSGRANDHYPPSPI